MDKIELFYNIVDSGDGSGHLEWYEDEELRDAAVENTDDECSFSLGEGSVETFRGSDIHHQAMDNNK
jgi:hypothetical protein